jgi:hypothetical protein
MFLQKEKLFKIEQPLFFVISTKEESPQETPQRFTLIVELLTEISPLSK